MEYAELAFLGLIVAASCCGLILVKLNEYLS